MCPRLILVAIVSGILAAAASAQAPLPSVVTEPRLGVIPACAMVDMTSRSPEVAFLKLRNTAAADVSQALLVFVASKKMAANTLAEPTTNTLFVAGDAGAVAQLVEIARKMDVTPQLILVQVTCWRTPVGFLDQCGVTDGKAGERAWSVSERERRMLLKSLELNQECHCWAKEQSLVTDNATSEMSLHESSDQMLLQFTPRLQDKGILLNVQSVMVHLTKDRKTGHQPDNFRLPMKLDTGYSSVYRAGKSDDGEQIVIVTPVKVQN